MVLIWLYDTDKPTRCSDYTSSVKGACLEQLGDNVNQLNRFLFFEPARDDLQRDRGAVVELGIIVVLDLLVVVAERGPAITTLDVDGLVDGCDGEDAGGVVYSSTVSTGESHHRVDWDRLTQNIEKSGVPEILSLLSPIQWRSSIWINREDETINWPLSLGFSSHPLIEELLLEVIPGDDHVAELL